MKLCRRSNDPEAERAAEVQMLDIFYSDPPWLLLYPGPILEAVSNRVQYEPRLTSSSPSMCAVRATSNGLMDGGSLLSLRH